MSEWKGGVDNSHVRGSEQFNPPVCKDSAGCCKELSRVWQALEITGYTGKSASDEVRELKAELSKLTEHFCIKHDGYASCPDCVEEYRKTEAELSRLREAAKSERIKGQQEAFEFVCGKWNAHLFDMTGFVTAVHNKHHEIIDSLAAGRVEL